MLLWHCFLLSVALISDHQLVYRAICIVALQSLVFYYSCLCSSLLKFPAETLYVSPFRVAGSNPSLYSVQLYYLENRVKFGCYCLPLGSCLGTDSYCLLAYQESNKNGGWLIGSVAMIVVSISRAAWVCFPVTLFLTLFVLVTFTQPIKLQQVSKFPDRYLCPPVDWFSTSRESFDNARASLNLERFWLR